MSLQPDEFIFQLGNRARERELISELKRLPEAEQINFLKSLIVLDPAVGLYYSKRVSVNKKFFYWLLDQAVRSADASAIQEWIECVVSKLGFEKTINYLIDQVRDAEEGVKKAAYWLPKFLPPDNAKGRKALERLKSILAEKAE